MIIRLKVTRAVRGALCFVFSLGLLTTICSVLRITEIHSAAQGGDSSNLIMLSAIELNVGVSAPPASNSLLIFADHCVLLTIASPIPGIIDTSIKQWCSFLDAEIKQWCPLLRAQISIQSSVDSVRLDTSFCPQHRGLYGPERELC